MTPDPLLDEQIAYYRARAPEYDDWFLRHGRYDQGPDINAQWAAEVDEVAQALEGFAPGRRVLELAGGTGIWTEQLARTAEQLTVVDASPEAIAINRSRVNDPCVRYIEADLFSWEPGRLRCRLLRLLAFPRPARAVRVLLDVDRGMSRSRRARFLYR